MSTAWAIERLHRINDLLDILHVRDGAKLQSVAHELDDISAEYSANAQVMSELRAVENRLRAICKVED
jgi:hypothetical protein